MSGIENGTPPSFETQVIQLVSRGSLRRIDLSEAEISQFSDTDLAAMARMIYDHFINDVFWDELSYTAEIVLDDKKRNELDSA